MTMILTGSGTGTVGVPNSGTAQNSTSGTAIDFTGIPAGIKRITVMFNGVSTNGSSLVQVQIGSGSVTTSGYAAVSWDGTAALNTTGFPLNRGSSVSSAIQSGLMTLVLLGSNTWVESSVFGRTDTANVTVGSGSITLSGTLDRIRITTVNGTDTFDAGSINILYE